MLFNSIHFLIFFPSVLILYFAIPHKYRWILILISSYYFYMSWRVDYIVLLILSTLVDYYSAISISKTNKKYKKNFFLVISLCSNIGILVLFKYFTFINNSIGDLLDIFTIKFTPLELNVLLPLGISFYTFQTLGYTIDVYRGKKEPEKHLGIFACYVSFFPQLVAGPIERAKNLLPQFYEKHNFEYNRVTNGLKLMLWGFFKKLVIADTAALVVNQVYNNVGEYSGSPLILATIFFAFQIYCDFSGYSDIAIGAAQVLGFKLMKNFKRPYFSKSIVEFWRRWHISLSTWFRDYLYIPLGGNRVSIPRWYLNLSIVFLVAGLWHGANWTFVIWGLINGSYLILFYTTKKIRSKIVGLTRLNKIPRIHLILQILTTFCLVNFGWIFFRANTVSDAFYIITHLFTDINPYLQNYWLGMNIIGILIVTMSITFMLFVHLLEERIVIRDYISYKPIWIRWSIYLLVLFAILLFGTFEQPFIYFQF